MSLTSVYSVYNVLSDQTIAQFALLADAESFAKRISEMMNEPDRYQVAEIILSSKDMLKFYGSHRKKKG